MNPMLKQLKSRLNSTLRDIELTPIADASVLIAITDEKNPKMMLTLRASHMKSHAGEVSFPGGKYELNDNSNVRTALRESQEETSLLPELVDVIGQLPMERSKAGLSVRPILGIIPPNQSFVPEVGEISRIFWAELDWLVVAETVEYRVSFDNPDGIYHLKTPSWSVEGETVWGLTGKIIANMLELGFDRKIDWYYKSIT